MWECNGNRAVNLIEWGKAYYWNNAQGSALRYYPIKPQTLDGGKKVWLPQWSEEAGEWHLGFEWEEPREVAGVEIIYSGMESMPRLQDVKIQYWNSSWPTPMPERWQGARSGWMEMEDSGRGKWIWARGEAKSEGGVQSFFFDPLDIAEIDDPKKLEWAEEYNVSYRKTLKIRVAIKGSIRPVISSIRVSGTAEPEESSAEIRFGCPGGEEDWSGDLQIHNGSILGLTPVGFGENDSLLAGHKWNCHTKGTPKGIHIKYLIAAGSGSQGDQTFISIRAEARSFTFLATDLNKGPIWIKDYGVLISRPLADGDWKKEIEKACNGAKPIYDRIGEEPEQSFRRAAEEIPPLDVTKQAPYGRYTILGWEGVKQEFALRYNGEVFADKHQVKMSGRDTAKVRWPGNSIHFRFGSGDPVDFRQRKDGARQCMMAPQLPVYITQWEDREVEYTQTTFGALIDGAVAGPDEVAGDEDITAVIRLKIRNTTEDGKKGILCLDITPAEQLTLENDDLIATGRLVPSETVKEGWKVQQYKGPRYRLHVDTKGKGRLKVHPLSEGGIATRSLEIDRYHLEHFGDMHAKPPLTTFVPNALAYEIELPGFSSHEIDIFIPFPTYSPAEGREKINPLSFDALLREVVEHWNGFHKRGAGIELPDRVLESFFKAVPWHILLTADRDPVSQNYMVPAATYAYDVCGNEAWMEIRLLDILGYHNYAERYLDTFINTQGAEMPDGNFASKDGAFVAVSFDAGETVPGKFGYNLDHGFIMACFADHYFMTGDKEWLERVSNHLVEACEFVIRERKATMRTDEGGVRVREYGLLPMGHLEDNAEWKYWFAVNGQACGGVVRIAGALSEIGHPEAPRILEEAEKYREDIRAAVQRAVEESAVVQLRDGTYIPHVPTRTAIRGRDCGWFREAGYGPLHLVDGLVLGPEDEKVTWILKDLEDNIFVSRRYGRPVDLERYWFSQGGVTIQANVLNNGPAYLLRDQTAHAIRALYNNIGQNLYRDVLAFTEHAVVKLGEGFGPFFKASDEAQFLVWLRNYLVREEGDTLWICQGAPRQWYMDGETIKAHGMASAFGTLGFSVESMAASSLIHASINIPDRKIPDKIYIRLRHPDGKKMQKVTVNGEDCDGFDKEKEIVIISGRQGRVDITVQFDKTLFR